MFDIGWQELFIVGLIAIIVVGPKELPRVLRTVTLGIRKVRGMARDFQDGIDELAREADLQDLRKEIEEGAGTDFEKEFESIADPARELEQSVQDIGGSLKAPDRPARDDTAKAETPNQQSGDSGPAKPDEVAEPQLDLPAPEDGSGRKAGGAS